ncbi:hypothetical protein B0J18DRAFT_279049 [Chaetomium sp. MPI-SDFR-AT-0129]|uniref:Uncharacterized protein n=1 Tax=Dichotomopilus funicola TaxID=1934379 RepID=A0AAN6ZMA5_9PEZI|nr:hypothetical protein B0J18DRAFT_279049 [Chaetomium sp. MPI-SDFR-AT-0129]KAK4142839.1 hypothetical protein C8A04DRAFT_29418 [Dichotomopilus funicola]
MSPYTSYGAVVIQSGSHGSSSSAPKSSTAYASMSSQTNSSSGSTSDARYRSGSSTSYYTDIKEIRNSRGGSETVVVHHNKPNPDKSEPRSSDRYYTK